MKITLKRAARASILLHYICVVSMRNNIGTRLHNKCLRGKIHGLKACHSTRNKIF